MRMAAVTDDRTSRGAVHDILAVIPFIEKFDALTGHKLQHEKTGVAATHHKYREALRRVRIGDPPEPLKVVDHTTLEGEVITTRLPASREEPDARVARAVSMSRMLLSMRIGRDI